MVQKSLEILEQSVFVLVNESVNRVHDIASVVTKTKAIKSLIRKRLAGKSNSRNTEINFVSQFLVHWFQLTTRKVLVLSQLFVHRFQQHFVVDFANSETRFVHDSDYTFMRCFDQVANNLVVEIINVRPRDALTLVFLLFLLQNKLDEELLQFLIAVVDAKNIPMFNIFIFRRKILNSPELLEAVDVKYLKSVNIENADDAIETLLSILVGNFDGFVDAANDPGEKTIVNRLRQRISSKFSLRLVVTLLHNISMGSDDSLSQSGSNFTFGNHERLRQCFDLVLVLNNDLFFLRAKLNVSQMQNRRNSPPNAVCLFGGKTECFKSRHRCLVIIFFG